MNELEFMQSGIHEAKETMNKGIGGPFGATIVKDGKIVAVSSNHVLSKNDPTAHAEVEAIREACNKLSTYDLSGCEIYATAQPCPMCLAAIMWANIKKVRYGCSAEDTANIGFRDDFMYNFIENKCTDASILELEQVNRDECIKLFEEYSEARGTLY